MAAGRFVAATLSILSIFCAAGVAGSGSGALAAAESRFANLDGARVHYKSIGSGRNAVVLVHGWTCDMNFWRDQVDSLKGKFRVVAVDLPGHGLSDKPRVAYTMDHFARGIDAALRDAGVDKAVLVGHSMGTPVIRQFYRRHPEKTAALVIVDGGLRSMFTKEMAEQFISTLRGPNYKEQAARMVDGMLMPVKDQALRDQIKASMLATPQHVAVGAMEGMMDPEIYKADKINVPVLAILAKSPFWAADTEQFLRGLAPGLEYHMWEGVSHFLMMERPAQFNETLLGFMTRKVDFKGK